LSSLSGKSFLEYHAKRKEVEKMNKAFPRELNKIVDEYLYRDRRIIHA